MTKRPVRPDEHYIPRPTEVNWKRVLVVIAISCAVVLALLGMDALLGETVWQLAN